MHIYFKTLIEEIQQNPFLFSNRPYETLLELLWYFHTEEHPISNDSINAYFDELEHILSTLSNKRKRKLIHTVQQLCYAYERDAFLQGIRTGVQLLLEATKDS